MAETAPDSPRVPMGKGQPGSLLRIQEILFQEPPELLGSLFPPILLVGKGLGWTGMDWDALGVLGCWVGGQVLPKLMLGRCQSLNIIPSFSNREHWECFILFYWILKRLQLPVKLFHKTFLLPLLNLDFT